MSQVNEAALTHLLAYVQEKWRAVQLEQLETGVWAALHSVLPASADQPTTPVVRAWILNNVGIQGRSPLSFKIFSNYKPEVHRNSRKRLHEMGECNIAPYPQPGLYYVDFVFGPLEARATRVEVTDDGIVERGDLWVA